MIAIIGLGYVGLPLYCRLREHFDVVGFDLNQDRVLQLKNGIDKNGDIDFSKYINDTFTSDPNDLANCQVYIITVPTPILQQRPDLSHIKSATEMVAKCLRRGDLVIYESTVYPGTTEEICVPILEKLSCLDYADQEFGVGYSPERVVPGDKERTIEKITKVYAASSEGVALQMEKIYSHVTDAGLHKAENIREAEAAKLIENVQRDTNIALMNELSMLFHKLNINTENVLRAARTKWNFLPFTPGFVGGHCIGVDPYYLIYQAEQNQFQSKLVKTSREVNEEFVLHAANLIRKQNSTGGSILILGATFKPNCADLRNSKVFDLYNYLKEFNAQVSVHDAIVPLEELQKIYGDDTVENTDGAYDSIILAVPHSDYVLRIENYLKSATYNHFYDFYSATNIYSTYSF